MGREPKGACQECGAALSRCICERLNELGIVNGGHARNRKQRRRAATVNPDADPLTEDG